MSCNWNFFSFFYCCAAYVTDFISGVTLFGTGGCLLVLYRGFVTYGRNLFSCFYYSATYVTDFISSVTHLCAGGIFLILYRSFMFCFWKVLLTAGFFSPAKLAFFIGQALFRTGRRFSNFFPLVCTGHRLKINIYKLKTVCFCILFYGCTFFSIHFKSRNRNPVSIFIFIVSKSLFSRYFNITIQFDRSKSGITKCPIN